jgi:predicted transposase YbfD/YdcC
MEDKEMENKNNIGEYFAEVETIEKYSGYFFSVSAAITISILGTFCGLRNMKQIHQWASNSKIREFLSENFGIENLACYSWYTQVLGLIKPESFNECFIKWVIDSVKSVEGETVSFDGKTVRSTSKMKEYKKPLHIVSAQIAGLGITFGQKSVDGKSNEIPAVRELMELLDLKGCLIVADALNCQKETVKTIIRNGGDYLLSVKKNQATLNREIVNRVEDASFQETMDKAVKEEKNRGRMETRTAYTTSNIDWLFGKESWENLACIGAINTQFETEKGKSNEWHYFISSRKLTADELLKHSRLEWSVETMHWLLDVHFREDYCRVIERRTQENLNIIRKIVLNSLRFYKNFHNSKAAFSHLMLDCMIDHERILDYCFSSP